MHGYTAGVFNLWQMKYGQIFLIVTILNVTYQSTKSSVMLCCKLYIFTREHHIDVGKLN